MPPAATTNCLRSVYPWMIEWRHPDSTESTCSSRHSCSRPPHLQVVLPGRSSPLIKVERCSFGPRLSRFTSSSAHSLTTGWKVEPWFFCICSVNLKLFLQVWSREVVCAGAIFRVTPASLSSAHLPDFEWLLWDFVYRFCGPLNESSLRFQSFHRIEHRHLLLTHVCSTKCKLCRL